MNDQLGEFASGHDLHASIGHGNIFAIDSDSVELLYYAVNNFELVLEYTKDQQLHAKIIEAFLNNQIYMSRTRLLACAKLCAVLATKSQNEYQNQAYQMYKQAFTEIAEKEEDPFLIGSKLWKTYGLNEKCEALALYSTILNI